MLFFLIINIKIKKTRKYKKFERHKYYPQPNIIFLKSGFSFFLSEFDSESNYKDNHQLIAQIAYVHNLTFVFLKEKYNKEVFFFL